MSKIKSESESGCDSVPSQHENVVLTLQTGHSSLVSFWSFWHCKHVLWTSWNDVHNVFPGCKITTSFFHVFTMWCLTCFPRLYNIILLALGVSCVLYASVREFFPFPGSNIMMGHAMSWNGTSYLVDKWGMRSDFTSLLTLLVYNTSHASQKRC
jgi:hypothetical protein